MPKKFHINPETGRPNQCTATVKDCKYATDGQVPEHYSSKEEARAAAEKTLSNEYGNTSTLKKDSSKNKPTKQFKAPTRVSTRGYTQNSWIGSRRNDYDETANGYLGAKEVATNIRQDVKEAVKAGYLPNNLKYSITTDKFSGGFAIRTRISGMGDVYDTHEYSANRFGLELKPEHRDVIEKIQTIQDGWNYNDSDGSIDYFNTGFYGDVREVTPSEEAYVEADKSQKAFNKVLKAKQGQDLTTDAEALAAERNYYDKLQKYIEYRELENELFDTSRKYEELPDSQSYEKIKEIASMRAQLKVIESKKARGIRENADKFSKR